MFVVVLEMMLVHVLIFLLGFFVSNFHKWPDGAKCEFLSTALL